MQTKSKTVDAYRSVCAATERVIVCKSLSGNGAQRLQGREAVQARQRSTPCMGLQPSSLPTTAATDAVAAATIYV